jgi:hypothetical protein
VIQFLDATLLIFDLRFTELLIVYSLLRWSGGMDSAYQVRKFPSLEIKVKILIFKH